MKTIFLSLFFSLAATAAPVKLEDLKCKAMISDHGKLQEALLESGFTGINATIKDYFFSLEDVNEELGMVQIMNLSENSFVWNLEFSKPYGGKGFLSKIAINKDLTLMLGCKNKN